MVTACYLFLAVNSCSEIPVLKWWDSKQFIVTYHSFSANCMQCTWLVANIILKVFFFFPHIGYYEMGCKIHLYWKEENRSQ